MIARAADVTYDRLLNADKEPQNWLMNHRDYSSHRFSPLDQINKDNVKNLHVAFTTAIGGERGGGTSARNPSRAVKPAYGRVWRRS